MLEQRSILFREAPVAPRTEQNPVDFNEASDDMDRSFQYLRRLLDQVSKSGNGFFENPQTYREKFCEFVGTCCLEMTAVLDSDWRMCPRTAARRRRRGKGNPEKVQLRDVQTDRRVGEAVRFTEDGRTHFQVGFVS